MPQRHRDTEFFLDVRIGEANPSRQGSSQKKNSVSLWQQRTVEINPSLTIPDSELDVKATRASGAGGQHVNKTSSRIEITWNITNSRAITDEQRTILRDRLANRISSDGAIRVVASESRSQKQNRDRAEIRLAELVRKALTPRKKRKPTRRPKSADEARLASKKLRSRKKRERRVDEY